jgi:hypothetical protein
MICARHSGKQLDLRDWDTSPNMTSKSVLAGAVAGQTNASSTPEAAQERANLT